MYVGTLCVCALINGLDKKQVILPDSVIFFSLYRYSHVVFVVVEVNENIDRIMYLAFVDRLRIQNISFFTCYTCFTVNRVFCIRNKLAS